MCSDDENGWMDAVKSDYAKVVAKGMDGDYTNGDYLVLVSENDSKWIRFYQKSV